MDFVIQWLWYLLAYVVGSAVAWLITVISIRRTSEEEALADLLLAVWTNGRRPR